IVKPARTRCAALSDCVVSTAVQHRPTYPEYWKDSMKTPRTLIAAALASVLFAAPAFAQNSTATLRVDIGSAMVSTGGEFVTAPSGSQLAPGSRVMLTEGNQATLVYSNGCTQSLTTAGVHTV